MITIQQRTTRYAQIVRKVQELELGEIRLKINIKINWLSNNTTLYEQFQNIIEIVKTDKIDTPITDRSLSWIDTSISIKKTNRN
jgi:hypothetical protein